MNLKQFMMHGQVCPICSSNSMNMRLDVAGIQAYRYENDDIIFTRNMKSLGKGSSYVVDYAINGTTSKVKIEFFHKGNQLKNSISVDILSRFKKLDKNNSPHFFSRTCTNCNKYYYISNHLAIDFKTNSIGNIEIAEEFFGICKLVGSQYRVFRVHNYLNKCQVVCLMAGNSGYAEVNVRPFGDNLILNLPPIQFTTEHELSNRINKLLPFA